MRVALLLLALALTVFPALPGEEPAAPAQPPLVKAGGLSVRVTFEPAQPRLSQIIRMHVELEAPEDLLVEPLPYGGSISSFTILNFKQGELEALPDGGVKQRWTYELQAPGPGSFTLHLLGAGYRTEKDAPLQYAVVETWPLEVASAVPTEPDLSALHGMREPEPIRDPWAWLYWAVPALALLALAALGLIIRWRILKRGPPAAPPLTPEAWARQELERLKAEGLIEANQVDDFYVRLTGIVRTYIEKKTGLHAPEQTTPEFLRDARHDPRLDAEQVARLESFLNAADLVKFAGLRPRREDMDAAFERAGEFLALRGAPGLIREGHQEFVNLRQEA